MLDLYVLRGEAKSGSGSCFSCFAPQLYHIPNYITGGSPIKSPKYHTKFNSNFRDRFRDKDRFQTTIYMQNCQHSRPFVLYSLNKSPMKNNRRQQGSKNLHIFILSKFSGLVMKNKDVLDILFCCRVHFQWGLQI